MKRIILILTILAAFLFQSWSQTNNDTIQVKICPGETFYYFTHDTHLKIECVPGLQYVDTYQDGSVVHVVYVNLTVLVNPEWNEYETLCQNETLYFRNNIIKGEDFTLGEHTLQFFVPSLSSDICDTLMFLHLTVVQTYNDTIEDKICLGEPYYLYGFGLPEQTVAGTFYHTKTLETHYPYLCDSIVTLKLTVNPKKDFTINAEICEGETYSKYGFHESTSGTYTHTGTSAAGCDSTTTLVLTVHNNIKILEISACKNDLPAYYRKKSNGLLIQLVEGLQIVDTIPSAGFCDSIIYVNLTVNKNPQWNEYKILCRNETLNFRNNIIHGADYSLGTHTLQFYVPATYSCDTLMFLHLTVAPAYNDTIEDKICLGESYSKYGFVLPAQNTAGTFYYPKTLQTHFPNLCDSIVTLKLTVNPIKKIMINAEICEGETYSENGFNENVSGTYTHTGTTSAGCDSTTTLVLTVHNNIKTLEISTCNNELPAYYRKKSNGLIIQLDIGLQIVDTIPSGGLCDSIIYVNHTVKANPIWHEYATLCQNQTQIIHNKVIHGADYPLGTNILQYYVHSSSANSCDTLMTLHLTILPTYNDTISDKICQGESYAKYGFILPAQNSAGTFYHTKNLQTHFPNLCDSIVTLKLTVNPTKEITIHAEICEGETYIENGFNESLQGTYTNTGTTSAGCDSTTTLILTVHNAADTLELSACNNDFPYYYTKLNGLIIECVPGLQIVDTISTGTLCDLVIYANFTVKNNPPYYKYKTLCQNETFVFYNNIIHAADYPLGTNTLQYYVPSLFSCDTLMTLFLTVIQTYNDTIVDNICLGEPYSLHGFGLPEQNAAGIFYHTLTQHTQSGCDSLIVLKLIVNPTKETTIYAAICEGDTYSQNGFNESVQGTYTLYGTTTEGCDSTSILILTVHNAADTLEISACRNELPYYYQKLNGLLVACTPGLQVVDTIITGGLCDVEVYVNLTVIENPPYHKYATLCQNKTLNFYNHIINGADYPVGLTILQYYVPFAYSCDTLFILHLTVLPSSKDTIEDKICKGEPYYKHGFGLPPQNTAGTFYYSNTLQNHCNCDSIIILKLTVNPQKEATIYGGICEGETYTENGFNESVPGIYKNYGTSAEGCDSTAILILSVYQAGENRVIFDTICNGSVYQEYGFNVNETGTYIEDRLTNDGCPYTLTLNLTVLLNLKMDTLPLLEDICGDAANFPIKFKVLDGKIDKIFVSFNEEAIKAGFRNFVEHNPNNNNIKIPLPRDVRPDNYSVTLYAQGRCSDTTFTVDFTILYPASIMQQRWNDVIVLKNPAYNGGYYFSVNRWLVNGSQIPEQYNKGSYIYYPPPETLHFGSEYRALLTRVGEYQSFCSCPLIPVQHSVYGSPRVVSETGRIKVYSDEPIVEVYLINMLGQTLIRKQYANTEIEINANRGAYIIRLVTEKGQIYNQKIIVQ